MGKIGNAEQQYFVSVNLCRITMRCTSHSAHQDVYVLGSSQESAQAASKQFCNIKTLQFNLFQNEKSLCFL